MKLKQWEKLILASVGLAEFARETDDVVERRLALYTIREILVNALPKARIPRKFEEYKKLAYIFGTDIGLVKVMTLLINQGKVLRIRDDYRVEIERYAA